MREIQDLSDNIEDEIHDAKKYIKLALKYKEEKPDLAQRYFQLSTEEMGHMKILHDEAVKMINRYREQNGDPPPEMQVRYDYLHAAHIKQASKVNYLQAMYKDG